MRYGLAVLVAASIGLIVAGNLPTNDGAPSEVEATATADRGLPNGTDADQVVEAASVDSPVEATDDAERNTASRAEDAPRLALLIGNQDYTQEIGPLRRALQDVAVIGEALEEARFEVEIVENADAPAIRTAILDFADRLTEAGPGTIGFFYYAGHGAAAERAGRRSNFIVPIVQEGTLIESQRDLFVHGVDLGDQIDLLAASLVNEAGRPSSLFFVSDACRNSLRIGRTLTGARGFGVEVPRPGLFIAQATLDGAVAPDDGAFAEALAENIRRPNILASRAFQLANRTVAEARESSELPSVSDALREDICFVSCPLGEGGVRALLDQQAIDRAAERGRAAELELERGNANLALLLAYDGLVPLFDPDGALPLGEIVRPGAEIIRSVDHAFIALNAANVSTRDSLALEGHTNAVGFAAFSPDGARMVTASNDRTARLWDAATGAQIATLEGHWGPVNSAAFSPDGARVVTASGDHTARVWDAASGAQIAALEGHTSGLDSAAFSPDGARVVTASRDRTARLWDAATGAQRGALEGHEHWVYSAAFSPDGARVVTASGDHTARVWDAASGVQIVVLEGHEDSVISAAFSPEGSRVVTASGDHTARVWDAASGAQLAALEGHENYVSYGAFSSDGASVVTASGDRTARVWELSSGAQIAVLGGHEGPVASAAFGPGGARVVTVSREGTVRHWRPPFGPDQLLVQVRDRLARIVPPQMQDCRRYDLDCAAIIAGE